MRTIRVVNGNPIVFLLLCVELCVAIFPREESERHAYIIVSTAGDLSSAARDAVAHGVAFARRGFVLHYFLDVGKPDHGQTSEKDVIIARLKEHNIQSFTISEENALDLDLGLFVSVSHPVDILVAISSHGWISDTSHEYITFKSRRYTDIEIRNWFTPLQNNPLVQVLVLVDTCHSGNMCKFPHRGSSLPPSAHICSISACTDAETDSDDISDEFGLGGGLTTSVMDFLNEDLSETFQINNLYNRCRQRLRCAGRHPQMCWL